MRKPAPNYQIVYLNGPSSSGKSGLIRAVQDALDAPFLHIGIDKVIGMMPAKCNDWEGGNAPLGFSWKKAVDRDGHVMQELQVGPFAKKMNQVYRGIVLTLAQLGHFFFIEDVAFGKRDFDRWKELLKDYKMLCVGVHAPLHVLEQREKERENRMVGSARAQYRKVHNGIDYDLDLDTHGKTLAENAAKILAKLQPEF